MRDIHEAGIRSTAFGELFQWGTSSSVILFIVRGYCGRYLQFCSLSLNRSIEGNIECCGGGSHFAVHHSTQGCC